MRILYAAFVRMPTEKAHGAQIMRTCEALVRAGAEITLALPGRSTSIKDDAFFYYDVKKNFSITPLRVPDWVEFGRIGFLVSTFLFARRVSRLAAAERPNFIYSRDKAVLLVLRYSSRIPLVWEVHSKEPRWAVWLLRGARFVAITSGIQEELISQGIPKGGVCVAHDGINLDPFARQEPKESARDRLGLPQSKKIVMYIGRLDGWKGVNTLLEASLLLKSEIQVVVIGGESSQIEHLRSQYPRVMFLGFLPYRDIAVNEAAADVLVLPNSAKDATSRKYTSPLKLFAYMASGVPMVVSDLPSLREVVSEQEVFFFKPDDAGSLAESLESALVVTDAHVKASQARQKVAKYTWDKRAEHIFKFLG